MHGSDCRQAHTTSPQIYKRGGELEDNSSTIEQYSRLMGNDESFPPSFQGLWLYDPPTCSIGQKLDAVEIDGRRVSWLGKEIVFSRMIAHLRGDKIIAIEIQPPDELRDNWARWNIQCFVQLDSPDRLQIANAKMDAILVRA